MISKQQRKNIVPGPIPHADLCNDMSDEGRGDQGQPFALRSIGSQTAAGKRGNAVIGA
jgi:hypothetical protein